MRGILTHDTLAELVVSTKDEQQAKEDWLKKKVYEEGIYLYGCHVAEVKNVDGYDILLEKRG